MIHLIGAGRLSPPAQADAFILAALSIPVWGQLFFCKQEGSKIIVFRQRPVLLLHHLDAVAVPESGLCRLLGCRTEG
ncbi:hypothetical protein D3C76_1724010 [compost metagenome]